MLNIWEKLKNADSDIVFPLGEKLNLGKSLYVKKIIVCSEMKHFQ